MIDAMYSSKKPPIHLWIYNHPFNLISDQVEFFVAAFSQHGYTVSVGRQPSHLSLNFVIENFSAQSKDVLTTFCRSARKRVAVIMTEHLDFTGDQIFIHGAPLWSANDYMPAPVQYGRIRMLLDCLPYIRGFFVLGDLPELRNISEMLPGIDVRSIPFPKLDFISNESAETPGLITSDLLFTGHITDYRANILAMLKANEFLVTCPQKFVSRKRRDAMSRSTKLVLNIPQREDWRWLSLMRVIAALHSGRATVSLGTKDDSQIAACCYQLDISDQQWLDELKESISNRISLYNAAYDNYTLMAEKFECSHSFPHDMLEFWAITDRLAKQV